MRKYSIQYISRIELDQMVEALDEEGYVEFFSKKGEKEYKNLEDKDNVLIIVLKWIPYPVVDAVSSLSRNNIREIVTKYEEMK